MTMTASPSTPLEQPSPVILICFSHLRWNFVYQRPQHLMSRAARKWRVIFLEEPVTDETTAEARADTVRDGATGVTVVTPRLAARCSRSEALAAQKRMLDSILEERPGATTIFWYYTPLALRFSIHREPDVIVYDCMDELSAFKGASPEIVSCEARLLDLADVVFTGGTSLYEAKRAFHPRVNAFPSSVDREHFAKARGGGLSDPADQATIGHPRIGYFGVIDERLDLDLVAQIAELKPDWQLVMIGPVVKIDEGSLPRRPNVHWLGGRSYGDLPAYMAHWDAGFMPFALNKATRFISPTKTPEFLAAGVPPVSSAIRDVVRDWGESGLVEIGASAEDFVARLETVMTRDRDAWLACVDERLAGLSWDQTWLEMERLVEHEIDWEHKLKELFRLLEGETSDVGVPERNGQLGGSAEANDGNV